MKDRNKGSKKYRTQNGIGLRTSFISLINFNYFIRAASTFLFFFFIIFFLLMFCFLLKMLMFFTICMNMNFFYFPVWMVGIVKPHIDTYSTSKTY